MTIKSVKQIRVGEHELEAELHKWTKDAWSVLSICFCGLDSDTSGNIFIVIFARYSGQ